MSHDNTPSPADGLTAQAEALVTRAGTFARWAARTGTEMARRLPGAAAVESELGQLERVALSELRRRLDTIDPLDDGAPDGPVENPTRNVAPPKQTEPLRVAMAELLGRSLEQSKQRAREYLYLALLRQLVPDEARILSALADGSTYPVVHVDCRTGVSGSRRVLSYASTVGRAAGVAVQPSVPRYLSRLLHFDLVELGEAATDLNVQYDILMTDQTVRDAEDAARAEGRARFVRATVRISPLGRDLWDACHPHADVEPAPEPAGAAQVRVGPAVDRPTRYAWEQVLPPEPAIAVPRTAPLEVPLPRPINGNGRHPRDD
ncbi:hypothetical protein GCM10017691_07160 [Pseudonocardia petroleophila]|nr:Abi-alpha family protein [Pseudonocardia petroleophila]